MPVVDIPTVGQVEFPDSMSDSEITLAIRTNILKTEIHRRPETGGAAGEMAVQDPRVKQTQQLLTPGPSALDAGQVPGQQERVVQAAQTEQAQRTAQDSGQVGQIGPVDPLTEQTTPIQLPRAGQPGSVARGVSDVAAGLGEFVVNKPEEFLASVYPPTAVAVLARYAPGIAKEFAIDAYKGVQGDKQALGRAGAMAAMIGLPFGAREAAKFRDRMKVSPEVDAAARQSLSVRPPRDSAVEVQKPLTPAETLLPRSAAAVEALNKGETPNEAKIQNQNVQETVPQEGQGVQNVPQEEALTEKPAPVAPGQAPETPAPTEAAVTAADQAGADTPAESQAISQSTPETSAAQPAATGEVKPEGAATEVAQASSKAQQKVKAVASEEGARPAAEIKSDLVSRIESAIAEAPSEMEMAKIVNKLEREPTKGEALSIREQQNKITINIPDDGEFKIANTKEALGEVLKRAQRISTTSVSKGSNIPRGAVKSSSEVLAKQYGDPVAKFAEGIKSVPEGEAPKAESKPLGVTPSPGAASAMDKLVQVGKAVASEIRSVPKFTEFKQSINEWNEKNQLASLNIRKLQADLESKVKKPGRREAITNWLQADGDPATLKAWESASKNAKRRAGYREAENLTPDEIKIAQKVRTLYDDLFAKAKAYGIMDAAIDNYVTQVWKQPALGGSGMAQFMSKLSRNFKFGKQRTFENFAEGEAAGFKPVTKDISKLLGLYVSELEKTIATRDLIRDLTTKSAKDGNPLAKPEGVATIAQDAAGEPSGPMFVKPGIVKGEVNYQQIDNPALAKWKWAAKDPESGRDVFMLGELRAHPDIARDLRNVLGQSQISKWMREPSESAGMNVLKAAARAGDTFSKVTKEVMLGTFSFFHHTQEGTHAVGHRINPFMPEKMPIDVPEFKDALDHGLQLAGDRAAMESFQEGLGAKQIFEKLGPAGRLLTRHNDLLFNEYIPRLKWATYQSILDRNMARFKPEIGKGAIKPDDVKYLTASQVNEAYGHLNYADLGRNPTVKHVMRLFALAPDFLEARVRFSAQAAKGLVSKVGREQLEAMAVLAGTFYLGSRVLNMVSTGDWNTDEPFGVRFGNRIYRMRNVPEDIWRAFKETRQFVYGRLNPVFGRGLVQYLSGVNYRGEKTSGAETLKEVLTSWIPIQMRDMPGFKQLSQTQRNTTISAWEHFLGSIGIEVSRYSPINKVHQLAGAWKKANGEPEDKGTYPVSAYQPLRYALEDGDLKAAAAEIKKLQASKNPQKLFLGFRESLFRPFAGSAAKERQFRDSLDKDGKKLYDEAVQQRFRIWSEFAKAREQAALPEPAKP